MRGTWVQNFGQVTKLTSSVGSALKDTAKVSRPRCHISRCELSRHWKTLSVDCQTNLYRSALLQWGCLHILQELNCVYSKWASGVTKFPVSLAQSSKLISLLAFPLSKHSPALRLDSHSATERGHYINWVTLSTEPAKLYILLMQLMNA